MSDYTDSGYDSFLSRSIDDNPQATLDSQGPSSTQMRYDAAQLSGSMGDKYSMGGIDMSARDSTITVNDGTIAINDTSTDSKILASSGNITYYDSNGNLVVQEGLLPDNTTGIRITDALGNEVTRLGRHADGSTNLKFVDVLGNVVAQFGRQLDGSTNLKFFDSNKIGLAQFGKFADGTIALKVAKAGIEVATATNDQLIFNSAQDIFKIVSSGTASVGSTGAGTANHTTVTHNLGFVPVIIALQSGSGAAILPIIGPDVSTGKFFFMCDIENVTTTTFEVWCYSATGAGTFPAQTIKYYLLQETAT